LISAGQTGAALVQVAAQTDTFTTQSVMLARAFMEKLTNFCYAGVCDESEFRRFVLHPVYKQYHNTARLKMEDGFDNIEETKTARKQQQEKLKQRAIVQEALQLSSETNARMNWTKKTMDERIAVVQQRGKLTDVMFTLNKIQYYADASEALHGSLYGCTYHLGMLDGEFNPTDSDMLNKKLYRDNAAVILHLGMLVHECFTLISYSCKLEEIWEHSYKNRNLALQLLLHILEVKQP
jgi:hypothetical protein